MGWEGGRVRVCGMGGWECVGWEGGRQVHASYLDMLSKYKGVRGEGVRGEGRGMMGEG